MTNQTPLEVLVYHQLEKLRKPLKEWSYVFWLDPKLVASILIVERFQYHTLTASNHVKRLGLTALDLLDLWKKPVKTHEKWTNIGNWINCSRSFSRIKWETAKKAWQMQGKPLRVSEKDLCEYTFKDSISVKMACLILFVHTQQWKPHKDLLSNPEILATLYNISDFTNKKPHKNPKPGGSIGSIEVDGVLHTSLNFADRTMLVYDSKSMNDFF